MRDAGHGLEYILAACSGAQTKEGRLSFLVSNSIPAESGTRESKGLRGDNSEKPGKTHWPTHQGRREAILPERAAGPRGG